MGGNLKGGAIKELVGEWKGAGRDVSFATDLRDPPILACFAMSAPANGGKRECRS